ncbi:uncharacterized protein LOC108096753 isoform X2 [Drosophila ficusphila]|uniref:uncharacterized protein LOC108096753 isoform X2 n=1 Tax=Drosophila ficusphila TaxID=30025 RepID=UPI0007E84BD2|nr:uncharacterized protein LOC108096753 isoform X2 [Drosophila ficusphila]
MKPRNGRLSKSILFTGFCVAVISTHLSNALDCYVCSYLDGYSDTSCLYNASAVKAINCTKKYCVTVRQELRMLYGNRPDETFRTYYTSCQQNLCNGHNGRVKNSTNGSGGGGIHNAVVPGKSASQGLLISSWSLIFLPFLALWR